MNCSRISTSETCWSFS